jgi:hypothetical protein
VSERSCAHVACQAGNTPPQPLGARDAPWTRKTTTMVPSKMSVLVATVVAMVTVCLADEKRRGVVEPLQHSEHTTTAVTVITFSGTAQLQNSATKGYVGCSKPCSGGDSPVFNNRYPLSLHANVCNTTVRDIAEHCRAFPHAVTLRSDAGLLRAYLQDTACRES